MVKIKKEQKFYSLMLIFINTSQDYKYNNKGQRCQETINIQWNKYNYPSAVNQTN